MLAPNVSWAACGRTQSFACKETVALPLLAVGWSWCGCPAVGIGASPLTCSMLRLMYTVAGPIYPDPA